MLYYSHKIDAFADEAIAFVSRITDKSGTASILERRKEPFSESEVRHVLPNYYSKKPTGRETDADTLSQIYAQWVCCYITSYLAGKPPGIKLSPAGATHLQIETASNLNRLLTICTMLLDEHRLDQICLLLQFLDIEPFPETQAYYRRRVQSLAKGMKKKRNEERALRDWHVERADKVIRDLRIAKDTGRDRWGWKAGLKISVGDGVYDLFKMKKD